ncbi:hypothetical protein RHMOL_Rhmol12G0209100 [Rhododendron molle]|uniref:Uncharacterized protein n=1 Tax=Rhododendron molle TaxID=49168 RepID=A0ACC0LLG7_RHOML|nr:hypothetical protein RHMOL_Rhmol12G0209100 [Rhododendron molle]
MTLLFPLYASVRAIETRSKVDDEQWLAYWMLYSFLTLMEMLLQPILEWIPIWYDIKLVFVAWLVLPHFRGAAFMYDRFVKKNIKKYGLHKVIHHKNKFLEYFSTPKKVPLYIEFLDSPLPVTHILVRPMMMLLYPLYASVIAIERRSKGDSDHEQWLAYWILYSFLTLMEMLLQPILQWIPIWHDIKLVFVAWLVLPQLRGATFMYERFVKKNIKKYGVLDQHGKGKN